MKQFTHYLIIAGVSLAIVLPGCNKKDDGDPGNNNGNNTNPSYVNITFSDSYGVLVSIKSTTYQVVSGFEVPVEVNTAMAAFVSTPGSTTFVDAGPVTVNTNALTKQSNHAYIYQDLMNPLNFSTVAWEVSGGSGVPAISYSDDKPWPGFTGYNTLPATVTRSAGVTVTLTGKVSNADSVYLVVAASDGSYAVQRVGGNSAEVTIPPGDLAGVSAGTGLIQVVPWSYKKEDFDSKDFYFVLEAVYSKMNVTIN